MSLLLPQNTGSSQSSVNAASFLPADYIQRKAELRNNIVVLSLFALVMGGVAGAFWFTNKRKVALGEHYNHVLAQCEAESMKIEQLRTLQKQRNEMMEKAEITAALLEPVPRWAVLAEVRYRMSDRIRLDNMQVKGTRSSGGGGGAMLSRVRSLTESTAKDQKQEARPTVVAPSYSYAITISGAAEENNDIADYLASLKASPLLRDVELTYIKEQREKDKILRQFEVTASLRTEVDRDKLGNSIRALIAARGGGEAAAPAPEPAPGATVGDASGSGQ